MKLFENKKVGLILIGLVFFGSFKTDPKEVKFDFHNYWSHYNAAEFQFKYYKNYKKALSEYKWLEKNGTEVYPGKYEFLNEAICCAKLGDSSKIMLYLRKSVLHGYVDIDIENRAIVKELGNKVYLQIAKELPGLKQQYYVKRAEEMPFMLEEKRHSSLDQYVRSGPVRKIISGGELDRLVVVTDSINFSEYISSLKSGKCPPTSWLNYHMYDQNEKYFPFIDSCLYAYLKGGKFSPSAYAFWYDRQLNYVQGNPQKYGEFINYGRGDTSLATQPRPKLVPISNVDSVDIYRSEIGLPPLWQDALTKDFDLPDGYQFPVGAIIPSIKKEN